MPKLCLCGCGQLVFSNHFALRCQYKRKDQKWMDALENKKNKMVTPLKLPKYKPTGEGILFTTLIKTRSHVSFISGLPIENPTYANCAHVLSKKQYPLMRLSDSNICLLTLLEHQLYDQGTEEQRQEYSKRVFTCIWKKLYDLKDILLEEYKNLTS